MLVNIHIELADNARPDEVECALKLAGLAAAGEISCRIAAGNGDIEVDENIDITQHMRTRIVAVNSVILTRSE